MNSSPRHSITSRGSNWAFSDVYGVIAVDSNFAELSRLPKQRTEIVSGIWRHVDGLRTQSTPPYEMGRAFFPASYFAFFLRSDRDEEIILSEQISISPFDLRIRPWDVLHYNRYILPITTGRFKSEQVRNINKKWFHTLKKNSKSLAAGSKSVTFSSSAFMESWSRWTEIWVWTLIQRGWLIHTTMVMDW